MAGCLETAFADLQPGGAERRHEALMEWAEAELGLERELAEQIYALAEEEQLEPIYAFQLIRCRVGVVELEPPEQDATEGASQQEPPDWVADTVVLQDVVLERRLRATFRRLRGLLERSVSPVEAARALEAEPDVGPLKVA